MDLLHFLLRNYHSDMAWGKVPRSADDMLLGAVFADRFIRAIFCLERKMVLWHLSSATIMTKTPKHKSVQDIHSVTHHIMSETDHANIKIKQVFIVRVQM